MRAADALADTHDVLVGGGFAVERRELDRLGPVLIAETPYALVMALGAEPDDTMHERVEDAQAVLTQLAAEHPSPRSWDLYLVLVVADNPRHYDQVREAFEADTRYARKLVVTGDRGTTEGMLRSLLPLHPIPYLELADPLRAVREHLLQSALEPSLVDAALASFESKGQVEIP